jgi:hypothetical protein
MDGGDRRNMQRLAIRETRDGRRQRAIIDGGQLVAGRLRRPVHRVTLLLVFRGGVDGQQTERKTALKIAAGALRPGAPPGKGRRTNGGAYEQVAKDLVGEAIGLRCVPSQIQQIILDATDSSDDPRVFFPIRGLQAPWDSQARQQMRGENGATIAIVAQVKQPACRRRASISSNVA